MCVEPPTPDGALPEVRQPPVESATSPTHTRVAHEPPTTDGALPEVRHALERLGVPVEWAEEILAHVRLDLPPDAKTSMVVAEVYRRA